MPLPIAPKKMADTVKVAKTTAKVRVKKSVKQTAALLKTPARKEAEPARVNPAPAPRTAEVPMSPETKEKPV